jgi:hypothetical protein
MAMRQSRAKVAIETRVEKCEGLGRYTAQTPFENRREAVLKLFGIALALVVSITGAKFVFANEDRDCADQDAGCQARKNRYSSHGYSHGFADQRWTTLFQTVLFSPDSYLVCEQCVLQSALARSEKVFVSLGDPTGAHLEEAKVRIAGAGSFYSSGNAVYVRLCARSSAGQSNGFLIQA